MIRREFQIWLAGRLKIDPDEVWLPEPATPESNGRDGVDPDCSHTARPLDRATPLQQSPRREAGLILETVEFTAVDFLADEAEPRCAEIHARFGPPGCRAGAARPPTKCPQGILSSFPLHELPLADRTINPLTFYETYLAGGRVALLPVILAGSCPGTLVLAIRGIYLVVHEILHPHVDRQRQRRSLRHLLGAALAQGIHRMRKPVFSWVRSGFCAARFDVEYLGLPLPTAPSASRRQ